MYLMKECVLILYNTRLRGHYGQESAALRLVSHKCSALSSIFRHHSPNSHSFMASPLLFHLGSNPGGTAQLQGFCFKASFKCISKRDWNQGGKVCFFPIHCKIIHCTPHPILLPKKPSCKMKPVSFSHVSTKLILGSNKNHGAQPHALLG